MLLGTARYVSDEMSDLLEALQARAWFTVRRFGKCGQRLPWSSRTVSINADVLIQRDLPGCDDEQTPPLLRYPIVLTPNYLPTDTVTVTDEDIN